MTAIPIGRFLCKARLKQSWLQCSNTQYSLNYNYEQLMQFYWDLASSWNQKITVKKGKQSVVDLC